MRYMLLIYGQEDQAAEAAAATADVPAISPAWSEYTDWLDERGMNAGGERLAYSSAATTVRIRDGNRLITDGPFTETKEVLGGYYILECEDLDQALEAAARCPGAAYGSVEVRPILQMPGMTGAAAGESAARASSSAR